ncbi:MAG: AMP-binding protein [Ekhidna sp.]|nr:AMP-binding protein [Ekhidna sp.]
MNIKSKNFDLKIDEILKDDLDKTIFNDFEKKVISITKSWHSGKQSFVHMTSGSTGSPKRIKIKRSKIILSADATFDFIDPRRETKSSLLCLDPSFIGGAMVIYRAMHFDHDLYLMPPAELSFDKLPKGTVDLASLAPIQYERLTIEEVDLFKIILIGGAPMPVYEKKSRAVVYSTFGMTETVSHIALRKLEESEFKTTGDTVISTQEDGSLSIKGSITDNNWLTTNDIIEEVSQNTFRWIGRKDFIINSGGIKINPEQVEDLLKTQIEDDFIISSLPDTRLGQKVILISSGGDKEISFSELPKYHQPKELFFNQTVYKTHSGKVDRVRTIENLDKKATQ